MDEWEAVRLRRHIGAIAVRAQDVRSEAAARLGLLWADVSAEHPEEMGLLERLEQLMSYLNPKWRTEYVPDQEEAG